MALSQINPFRGEQKASKLEQIALGVEIASKILGTGLEAYQVLGPGKEKLKQEREALDVKKAELFKEASQKDIDEGTAENVPGFKKPVVYREKPASALDQMIKVLALQKGQIDVAKGQKSLDKLKQPTLPKETQAAVTDLTKSVAKRRSVANQLEAFIKEANDPKVSKDVKIKLYQQTLKTLNSPENSDAVGKEEVNRLGSLLEYKIGNVLNPGSFIGRDVEEFENQLKSNINILRRSADTVDQEINRLKSTATPGGAGTPGLEDLNDEQLNQLLQNLAGE